MSLVRAISKGVSITPATPAAETATAKEARGDGDESMSRPPVSEVGPNAVEVKDSPGSGSASKAEKNDRMKAVIVESNIEWTNVLFVPFHIPHAPSAFQRVERADKTEEGDLRSRRCGGNVLEGGDCGVCILGIPSELKEARRRRPRGVRVGV